MDAVKKNRTRGAAAASYLAKVAMFSALAFLLHLLRIKLPFAFPVWLELKFSDLPALIGGFALGPVAGCAVTIVRILLKMIFQGSESAFVGDLADMIMGVAYVLPAALIYKYNRTKKGAIIGLAVGALCSIAASVIVNRFMLIPFYAEAMGMDAVIGMFSKLFPSVTENTFYGYYLWLSVVPFNILRCLIVSVITFFVYKRISSLLNKF